MTDKTETQTQTETTETPKNKPYGYASVPVEVGRGQTKWYQIGPVWNKKDGAEGFIVEVEVLPVGYDKDGPFRIVISPTKDDNK